MKKTHLNAISMIASIAFLLLTSLPSYGFDFGACGYYWRPDFSGEIRVDENSIIGTTINAEDDLGMGDESYPTLEVFF